MERTKTKQNKENSILIEETLKQKDITSLNIYLSNSGELNFTKSIILMLKTQINFIILIPNSFRSSERKNKQRSTKIKWNYILNKPKRHLQNIPPKHQKHIHSTKQPLDKVSNIYHILGHKTNLSKFRKHENILCMLQRKMLKFNSKQMSSNYTHKN